MIIAIDTGGTKTLMAKFDNDVTIQKSIKFATPNTFTDYIQQIKAGIVELAGEDIIETISIAAPGVIKDNVVEAFGNLPWKNVDIPGPLKETFPDSKILIENDANLGGLGEVRMLGTIPKKAIYITISTGIGVGAIINGHLYEPLSDIEAGHMNLSFNNDVERWESFGSGRAIYNTYGVYARDIHDESAWKSIVQQRIAPGFNAIIPVLQPELIIIGGSIGSYFQRYEKFLYEETVPRLHPVVTTKPTFVQAKHPEEAVVYGCYFHALDKFVNH